MLDDTGAIRCETLDYKTGLLGRGILASGSPWLHEKEAAALGLKLTYTLFDFTDRGLSDDRLADVILDACKAGYSGLNVTFPFKQAVIPLLDTLTDDANKIGAVNTIEFANGRLVGHNTDVTGFATGFREGLNDVPLDVVLQIGCGGAGSATAHALLSHISVGQLLLADTDRSRCENLYRSLSQSYGEGRVAIVQDVSASAMKACGIVNATPMGMDKFPGMPLPADAITSRHWVADIVYFPLVTELLACASSKGCKILDGSHMVVHQAAEAFEIFVKHSADRARMQQSFQEFAGQPQNQRSR